MLRDRMWLQIMYTSLVVCMFAFSQCFFFLIRKVPVLNCDKDGVGILFKEF